jgi:hypothetical protein
VKGPVLWGIIITILSFLPRWARAV